MSMRLHPLAIALVASSSLGMAQAATQSIPLAGLSTSQDVGFAFTPVAAAPGSSLTIGLGGLLGGQLRCKTVGGCPAGKLMLGLMLTLDVGGQSRSWNASAGTQAQTPSYAASAFGETFDLMALPWDSATPLVLDYAQAQSLGLIATDGAQPGVQGTLSVWGWNLMGTGGLPSLFELAAVSGSAASIDLGFTPTAVPEAGAAWLLLPGLLATAAAVRRRARGGVR